MLNICQCVCVYRYIYTHLYNVYITLNRTQGDSWSAVGFCTAFCQFILWVPSVTFEMSRRKCTIKIYNVGQENVGIIPRVQ